ncbi:cellobiose phosphorylase [Georgenia sp. 311]|uniref:cellobiose phosphorylase n=1 Tax=Georgenia sp. 311 TaxID=2585134 RepID=UPI001111AA84|nr:cellobiose phosphorylase [Georgenia sp. 311]TNC20539.1 cellobiose phosphorylase [Georgenia sp. 311]
MTGTRFPVELRGGGGLRALVVAGGGLASLTHDGLELVQHPASPFEAGLVQLWLRDRVTGERHPMLGAGSGSAAAVRDGTLVVTGTTRDGPGGGGLRWRAVLTLHPARAAWAWHVVVTNDGGAARDVDLVHTHDPALAGTAALRANELYVSQYLDLTPLTGPTGTALAVRQNLAQDGRHPWCVLAADAPVAGWATDALDVHGWAGRTGTPCGPAGDLPGRRRQHEHSLLALQTSRTVLGRGEELRVTFAGLLLPDHPAATSPDDVAHAEVALALARDTRPPDTADPVPPGEPAPTGAYDRGRELRAVPADDAALEARWPAPWRAVERGEDGALLSFFTPDAHVVTQAKELAVLRPHGTILRTGATAAPDPAGLTATAWMTGSPLSYLTRGHVTNGRVLTTVRGYLGLHRAHGLRVLVEDEGRWRLLDLPTAFAMTPDSARWTYLLEDGDAVEVLTRAPAAEHEITLRVTLTGRARRLLLALHLATDTEPLPARPGAVRAESAPGGVDVHVEGPGGVRSRLRVHSSVPLVPGDDAPLFDDGVPRVHDVLTLGTEAVTAARWRLRVERDVPPAASPPPSGADWWTDVTAIDVAGAPGAEDLAVSLPWLVRDAFVHFLSPRGLEQYTGGAWGTRDVTQGPLELLLALDRLADARALLLSVLAAQDDDGGWPQAFGFLPGDEGFRWGPAHGDIVHWPVLALGRYLLASGDGSVLAETVPWASGRTPTPVRDHVMRALDHARAGYLPGTHLVAYGHGDWNDSLQPADPTMATSLVSTWTVTLQHQALDTLADGLAASGAAETGEVERLRAEAGAVAADLRRLLLVDGELAGYAQLAGEPGTVRRYLVHPRDTETGLRHGALQTIHALAADLLDPAEAPHHVDLVRAHLMGADGVRLFDRPPGYHGGETRHFQRAETATFVGREIGLMYVHAHLRWCEAMARWGDADALWLGIRQTLAPAVPGLVPGARRRQANTYASSSDAAVLDRADFAARYPEVLDGRAGFEAGWRIYSSGPGVLVRVVTQSLLGVRRRGDRVEVDPVLPVELDGLTATVPLAGGLLRLRYHVGARGHGVDRLALAGRELPGERTSNPYRAGGLVVDLAELATALSPGGPELEVHLP